MVILLVLDYIKSFINPAIRYNPNLEDLTLYTLSLGVQWTPIDYARSIHDWFLNPNYAIMQIKHVFESSRLNKYNALKYT